MLARLLALLSVLIAFPIVSNADVAPVVLVSRHDCVKVEMCVAETDTGVCQVGGDEVVFQPNFRTSLTFYSDQGVGAYSCDMISNSQGHDAASGVGKQINSTSLTTSNPVITINGGVFDSLWIDCSAVGSQATVVLLACPASR